MKTKRFHIGTVLTVTTGRFLCSMEELYRIMSWMTGESLMTHQLPRAGKPCKEFLLAVFPELRDVEIPCDLKGNEKACRAFVVDQQDKYRTWFDVPSMPEGEFYKSMHPLDEPILKGKNVISVVLE